MQRSPIKTRAEDIAAAQKRPLLRPKLTLVELGNVGVVLKLEEAPLHHVLGVDLFHSQQVQNHVVRQSAIN